jgi:hypothetical protein
MVNLFNGSDPAFGRRLRTRASLLPYGVHWAWGMGQRRIIFPLLLTPNSQLLTPHSQRQLTYEFESVHDCEK